jgi:hypothetical protein
MTQRILLTLLSLFTVFCFSLIGIATSGVLVLNNLSEMNRQEPPLIPTAPAPDFSDLSAGDLPDEITRQMDEIQLQVSLITGLPQRESLHRYMLSSPELRQRVENDFFSDYPPEEIAKDTSVMIALGLLQPGYDLKSLLVNLYSEQIAGYYDPKTKEMFVVQGNNFGGLERMTYAHEFTHALQDQSYDLRQGLNLRQDYCENKSGYCSALTALIEGDAVLTEQIWFSRYSTPQDRQELQEFLQSYKSPILDSAPAFLREDMLFPYKQGLEFAATLFDNGGRDSIYKAFLESPVSSEQILHPDSYPFDSPQKIVLPDLQSTLGNTWRLLDQDTLGEWYISLILSSGWKENTRLPLTVAKQAASGWAGDTYKYYQNSSNGSYVMLAQFNFDNSAELNEFWLAFSLYSHKRWGDSPAINNDQRLAWSNTSEGEVVLTREGNRMVWLIAPDNNISQKIQSLTAGDNP